MTTPKPAMLDLVAERIRARHPDARESIVARIIVVQPLDEAEPQFAIVYYRVGEADRRFHLDEADVKPETWGNYIPASAEGY